MKNHNISIKSINFFIGIGLLIILPNRILNAQNIELVIVGQSLIKMHPEKHWSNPFATVRPILESADIGFTNFEMAVDNNCGLPDDYQVMLGKPALGSDRPGNTSGPHALHENVMGFLSSMNFKLQFGGFNYQGLQAEGAYDPLVWEGLLGMLTIKDGYIRSIEITPLTLNEGNEKEYGDVIEFREKRGFAEVARGVLASKILDRFKDLSAKYGTIVKIEGEKAIIKIRDLPTSKQ